MSLANISGKEHLLCHCHIKQTDGLIQHRLLALPNMLLTLASYSNLFLFIINQKKEATIFLIARIYLLSSFRV